mmetsp:Transcript_69472/g.166519  ORF Transcript_69472/g.166519 Transcript_69472/m.166519 type:complete len:128 (+) Transcript_69472:29-412(+)
MGGKQSIPLQKSGSAGCTSSANGGTASDNDMMGRHASWVDKASPFEKQMIASTMGAMPIAEVISPEQVIEKASSIDKVASEPWKSRASSEADMRQLFDEIPDTISKSAEVALGCTIVEVRGTYIGAP